MSVEINETRITCPWPTCKDYEYQHCCFGRPRSHLVGEAERHTAYPESLDSHETASKWTDLAVVPDRRQDAWAE